MPSEPRPPLDLKGATAADALMQTLKWLFDRVASATTPTGRLTDREIDRQIAFYCTAAGTAGFVTNIGGLLTLPISLPANLVGVAAIQLRLIAAIAAGRGHDVQSDEVKTVATACLTGNAALDIVKDAGIQLGRKLGQQAVNQIAGTTLARVNQAVGFRLLATTGSQGLLNITKAVPLIGGLVGGGVDAASTRAVGAIAKRLFVALPEPGPAPAPAPAHDQLAAPVPIA